MTPRSLLIEAWRGEHMSEDEQMVEKKEIKELYQCQSRSMSYCDNI